MLRLFLIGSFLAAWALPLGAVARVSLGYGLQLNSFMNSTLNTNLQKMILNSDGKRLEGLSGSNAYSSAWSTSNGSETTNAYALAPLPELRFSADWGAPPAMQLGVYAAVSGMVPQTTAYYEGAFQLQEGQTCSGVDYTKCPLAATNFVAAGGTATYNAELRSNLRLLNLTVGLTLAKKIAEIAGGGLVLSGEFGLNVQSFALHSQFVATRCSNSTATPCASNTQVRVVQSELKTTSAYAVGPVIGATLRYERPQSFWFAELGASVTVLFSRLENTGYTSFAAAGTVAFSQTQLAQGVEAAQNVIAVLPAVVLRAGVRL
ncbi:MAG: hypothetical protein J0L53_08065 [Spirochaetes bacterium]|nr:hypothetical protein [Spirochaetota bacterium]